MSPTSKELRPLYVFAGNDDARALSKLRALRAKFAQEDVTRLPSDTTPADVVGVLNEMPFRLHGDRLVVVDGSAWKADEVKPLVRYFSNPIPGVVVALRYPKPPKAIRESGRVFVYEEDDGPNLWFTITDAWGEGRKKTLLRTTSELLENGESPFAIAGRLSAHVRLVTRVAGLLDDAHSLDQIATLLDKNPWYLKKVAAHGRRRTLPELATAIEVLAELDRGMKGGSAAPVDLQLLRAVVTIA